MELATMTDPPTPAAAPKVHRILVTGDVVVDHYIYVGQQWRAGSTLRLGTRETRVDGGAALLFDLIETFSAADTQPRAYPVSERGTVPFCSQGTAKSGQSPPVLG
jgi:hypothetical protein